MSADPDWKILETRALEARARHDHAAALATFHDIARQLPQAGWVQVQIGTEYRSLGDAAAAAGAFEQALRLEPGNIYARNGLAQLARARGERETALSLFREIADLAPNAHWALTEAATDLLALGRTGEAQATYETLLNKSPSDLHAQLGLGKLARAANQPDKALSLLSAARQNAPDSPWPHLEAGAYLLELGRIDEAEQAYKSALGLNEAHLAELGLGRCARARGNRAGALRHFTRACENAPHSLWPWLSLANEQRDQGDFAAARATARKGLAHHPHEVPLWRNLAETEVRTGQLEDARQTLRTALGASPDDTILLVDLARLESKLGDLAAADERLMRALSLDPCHIAALALRTDFDLQQGDMSQSRACYARALARQPENLALRIGALTAQGAAGETHEALNGFEALAAAGHATPELYLAWGRLARETGYIAGALRLMQEATAKFPGNFWLAVERAQAALVSGQYQYEAERRFLQSVPVKSLVEQGFRQLFLGLLAERTGQIDTAIRYYEAAVRANPQDITCHMALARTKLLRLDTYSARHHLAEANALNAGNILRRGGSLNISQSHLGQLLDEYTLDRDLLADLRALAGFAPAHRAEALRLLVMRYPENVAAAATLMLALREAGRLDHVRLRNEHLAIPCMIGQFWDADPPPPDITALMASWTEQNPNYTVQRFSLQSAGAFLRAHYSEAVVRTFVSPMEPAKRADLFRLAWLYKNGGIYADADDRCLAPISSLLPDGADMVLYQEEYATFGNNFIATAPGNSIILRALQEALTAIGRGDSDILWLSTGPGLITRMVAQKICAQGTAFLPPGLAILQRHELHQAIAPHCKAYYKTTSDHWMNSAFKRSLLGNDSNAMAARS